VITSNGVQPTSGMADSQNSGHMSAKALTPRSMTNNSYQNPSMPPGNKF